MNDEAMHKDVGVTLRRLFTLWMAVLVLVFAGVITKCVTAYYSGRQERIDVLDAKYKMQVQELQNRTQVLEVRVQKLTEAVDNLLTIEEDR